MVILMLNVLLKGERMWGLADGNETAVRGSLGVSFSLQPRLRYHCPPINRILLKQLSAVFGALISRLPCKVKLQV